jgi:DNA-binding response OmpR family regulator
MTTKILIVEDEAGLRQGMEINLRLENYETALAADGEEAIKIFHDADPDLVLLDLMLPKKSGFEVLDHIRKFSKVPVILLTARGQEADKVRGLRAGADDYVTKPFGLQELFARIDAVVRRSAATNVVRGAVQDQLIKLDPATREASARDQKLKLSPKEFDLLMYLFRNRERVVPREELLSRVWNYRVDLNLNSRTVDTHVTRLRRKLQRVVGSDAAVIVAVAKIGYRYLGEPGKPAAKKKATA